MGTSRFTQRVVLCGMMLVIAGCLFWAGRSLPEKATHDAWASSSNTEQPGSMDEQFQTPVFGFGTTSPAAIETETPAHNRPPETGQAAPGLEDGTLTHWDASDIIGVNDILFQPETDAANAQQSAAKEAVTAIDLDKLRDYDYLRTQFYIVDADTGLLPSDVDSDTFLAADLTLDTELDGPKVLVFHTHSNEMYADSNPDDPMDGVFGAGALLADILTHQYGLETLHHTGRYDIVDGKSQIPGAYERMEPAITQILRDNPSIQLVIDLHRDGLREGVPPMVTDIDGKRTARIMFLNGMCRLRSQGVLTPVAGLANPYLSENMALSFQLQLEANHLYPNLTRKVYLKAYRYSLHMLPKSMLVEVGAQNNTKAEAFNAMPPLAEVIARVVKGE